MNISGETLFEESFRTLRTNLLLRANERDKIFLITSARPAEGKSTIAVNLARSLASGSRKVLLVDAELRKPRVHQLLRVVNQKGFTDLLRGNSTLASLSQSVSSNFSVLTSGAPLPRDPQESLLGGSLEGAFAAMRESFDIVIVDSAPVLAVADATLLATSVDGVIVVLKYGEVTAAEARLLRERLQSARTKLIGCVISHFSNSREYAYHPYLRNYAEEPVAGSDIFEGHRRSRDRREAKGLMRA